MWNKVNITVAAAILAVREREKKEEKKSNKNRLVANATPDGFSPKPGQPQNKT